MATASSPTATDPQPPSKWRPLRIWPPAFLILLMVLTRLSPRLFPEGPPELGMAVVMGPLICGGLVLIWWLTASRATWRERVAGLAGVLLSLAITSALIDPTMGIAGLIYLAVPVGMAAFAIGAFLLHRSLSFRRTWCALLLGFIGFTSSLLLRSTGMSGDYVLELHWRWTSTAEEIMLAEKPEPPSAPTGPTEPGNIESSFAQPEWPGFRGADRSGIQRGPAIATDWETNPPELLWKITVGPAWSSFTVAGNHLFTQEQRGPEEVVVCYDANTGAEIWARAIESRFEEALGGPGPRATPTLANGNLFALGAEGWLMRLSPESGEIIWKKDLREVADREPPTWGFSSSPCVTDSLVIVHAGGADDKGVLAFDIETGELRWSAASGDHSYSSPQLATIAGVESVLMPTNLGLNLLDPKTGASRLAYEWPVNGYRALQPQIVDSNSILLSTSTNPGTRRIKFSATGDAFTPEEMWTSSRLKPDFNDTVVYDGNAYGFDSSVFTCIDLATGERRWKGGRYGKGQVLLLENSGLLLIAAEQGEVVLLKATPEAHTELTRFKALKGKTWNHPVLIGDRLYVRNAEEAACYRLPMAAQKNE
jgi:outer membrane protein assembly factor BamB